MPSITYILEFKGKGTPGSDPIRREPHLRSSHAPAARQQFRAELRALQTDLRNYTRLLTEMEDLTDLESV
jgi:hypothetical protein